MKFLSNRRTVPSAVLRSVFALSMLAAATTACASSDADADTRTTTSIESVTGNVRPTIYGGHPDETQQAVVAIQTMACTGILIASNVVLTAHHCVAPYELFEDCTSVTYGPPISVARVSLSTRSPIAVTQSGEHAIAEIVPLPDPPDPERLCGDDLALLVLRDPIDANEVPPIVPRVDDAIVKGEPFSAVGFGKTSNDTKSGQRIRNRRDGVSVTCVGVDCRANRNGIKSREWVGEDESCSGDSGGAALDAFGRLIGVHNRGANVQAGSPDRPCSGTSIYINVASHADWLKREVARISTAAGLVPPAWATGYPTDPKFSYPVGDACSSEKDCASRHCVESKCTRECSAAAACPKDFQCDAESSLCTPIPPPASPASEGCAVAAAGETENVPARWTILGGGVMLFALFRLRRRRNVVAGGHSTKGANLARHANAGSASSVSARLRERAQKGACVRTLVAAAESTTEQGAQLNVEHPTA